MHSKNTRLLNNNKTSYKQYSNESAETNKSAFNTADDRRHLGTWDMEY